MSDSADWVHVAAAAIYDQSQSQVLLSLRPDHAHQGGLWEFPGGKLESGESVLAALKRELDEELGIQLKSARPLIKIHHQYADKAILLDVWRVDDFDGTPEGREGQSIEWVSVNEIASKPMPAADKPVIKAIELPAYFSITPDPLSDTNRFFTALEATLRKGIRLIQLRSLDLEIAENAEIAQRAIDLCHARQAKMVLNSLPEWVERLNADGLHLNSHRIFEYSDRPVSPEHLFSASCHDQNELDQAGRLDVDFALLSPVQPTASHPGAPTLGWKGFSDLCERSNFPIYALGGMDRDDLDTAYTQGAQGIAAIRALWG